jgi:hypothetical protein
MATPQVRLRRALICAAGGSAAALLLSGCGGAHGTLTRSDTPGSAGPVDVGQTTTPTPASPAPVPSGTTPAPTTTKAAAKTTTKKKTRTGSALSAGHVFIAAPGYGGPNPLLGVSDESTITVLGVSSDPSTQWYVTRVSSRPNTFQLMSPENSEEIDAYCLSNDARGGFSLAVCNQKAAQAFTFTPQAKKGTFTIDAAGGAVSVKDDGLASTRGGAHTMFTVSSTPEDS